MKWHDGLTCKEFKEEQENEKTKEEILSEEYAKSNLQECPNCNVSLPIKSTFYLFI